MKKMITAQDLYDFIGSEILAKGDGDIPVVLPWIDLETDEEFNQTADTLEIETDIQSVESTIPEAVKVYKKALVIT